MPRRIEIDGLTRADIPRHHQPNRSRSVVCGNGRGSRAPQTSDRSVAGSQIRGLGSPTLTSGICDSHDEPGRLGPAVLVQLCAAQNPLAVASVAGVHNEPGCRRGSRQDPPGTGGPGHRRAARAQGWTGGGRTALPEFEKVDGAEIARLIDTAYGKPVHSGAEGEEKRTTERYAPSLSGGVMAQSAPGLSSTDIPPTLCFYDSPAEHWLHLKTSSAIESTFATVRLRTKVTKGPGSRAAGLAMAFKLIEAAEDRWRYVNGAAPVALVRAGATFRKGVLVESIAKQEEVAA